MAIVTVATAMDFQQAQENAEPGCIRAAFEQVYPPNPGSCWVGAAMEINA